MVQGLLSEWMSIQGRLSLQTQIFLARKKCICGDGHKLPLPNDVCDVFVSLETLEHVGRDEDFVKEIHRVLRKGRSAYLLSTKSGYNKSYDHNIFVFIARK